MLTLTLPEPALSGSALVVVDPYDDDLIHAHATCAELADLIDLVERVTGADVDDPDTYDAALVECGLTLPVAATMGMRSCPSCWGQ